MSKMPSSLSVCVVNHTAFIKIIGRASFAPSVNFKLVINELRASGFERFVLDLTECVTMDSTFLGVLAGMALKLAGEQATDSAVCLQLLNPNQRISDLLENLGVCHLFKTIHGSKVEDLDYASSGVDEATPSRQEISATCLEAHETLMAINPDNVGKFKDVAQFLAEDLKKLKAQSCQ
jgi:anti-sigma B factor antagonist